MWNPLRRYKLNDVVIVHILVPSTSQWDNMSGAVACDPGVYIAFFTAEWMMWRSL